MTTPRYSSLKKVSIILGLIIGGAAIVGGLYSGAVWASTRQSTEDCEIEADAAEAGAVGAVQTHETLELEIHKGMVSHIKTNSNEIKILRQDAKQQNQLILKELRKNGHPMRERDK